MGNWYFYHSVKTMGHNYDSLGLSSVYIKSQMSKLCINDKIWVIEGDENIPTRFRLVDYFQYLRANYEPFIGDYSEFKMQIIGDSQLKMPVQLSKSDDWFDELHKKYITKQRFFFALPNDSLILKGLINLSSI